LNKASPTAATDTLGQSRLNYLRGDRSLEGTTFRTRSKLLGDIINSSVVYAGKPATGYTENSYSTFYSTNASRTAAVYVGANDGMLHAFNASTGAELFGYIPSWMATKLSALTGASYANNHQSYVDGLPAVGEACVGASHTLSATTCTWKSVLVSGTGAGGQGVFALDVTDPTAFSASKVMWEFTNTDDNDLGYVVGQPQILKMVTSAPGATSTTYRWFAVVASGVDNYVTDANGRFSSTGKPALFFLALDKAVGAAWTLGTNYYKVSLPLDTTLAASKAPGVTNFTALYDAAGAANRIFVGDLHGKLWKFDFTPRAVSTTRAAFDPTVLDNWNADNLSFFSKSGDPAAPTAYPMYIAKDATTSTNNQPIFSAPRAVTGPVVGGLQTFYVIFGTGKFLESGDKTSTAQNSIYAVYDDGKTTLNQSDSATLTSTTPSVITGRSRLQQGTPTTTTTTTTTGTTTTTTTTKTIVVSAFVWGRPLTDTATSTDSSTGSDVTQPLKAGWYFDLPDSGEKMISNFLDLSPQVTFNTIIPGAAGATGSCTATPGSGNQYVVNIATGNGTYTASTVGLLGASLYIDIDSGSSVTSSDNTGRRTRTTTKTSLQSGSTGSAVAGTPVVITDILGRLSWRQINNYWDLKAAP
jgi:type IV pilus assembly protein PilY1